MAGHLEDTMTCEERQRFDAALQKRVTDPARTPRLATPAPPPKTFPISEYEEHVWLAQQQAPEAVLKHVVACRLTGAVDLARLAAAIVEVVRVCPDLDARYRFGEDGELHKEAATGASRYLRLIRSESQEEAAGFILDRQAGAWDGERDPPFEALVIAGPRETVCALVLHRIVDAAHPAAGLLGRIADAYARKPVPAAQTSSAGARLLGAPNASAMLPAWMRRADPPATSDIVVHGERGLAPGLPVAGRFGVSIRAERLGDGARDASDRQILAHLAASVARFVSALSGSGALDLWIWTDQGDAVGDPSPSAASLVTLTVDGRESADRVLRAVVAGLDRSGDARGAERSPKHDLAAPAERPTVAIGWTSDIARVLRLDGISVARLGLPTLETRPDLSFTVGRDAEGGLAVELVTGQALSPHIGPVLLERFVAWLAVGAAALPGQPALAPEPPSDGDGAAGVSPEDPVAALILAEFREALNAPQMGPDDDFFDHGGHSLIATRILGRLLSRHGIELRFDDLFSFPSAAALARKARRIGPAVSTQTRGAWEEEAASAPLALAQASLWKAYAAFGFNEIFNLPFALDFLDPVDEALFERAFTDVIERHPGLRSLFRQDQGAVRQQIVPVAELSRYRWFWASRDSEGVDRRDEAKHRFDLAEELPFRIRFLIDPATGRQVLSFLFHHIALDEWSVNLMMDEIVACYRARAAGDLPHWSSAPAPFHEFAQAQHDTGIDAAHVAYWVDMLRGAPTPQPILARRDGEAPATGEHSAAGGWVEFKLDTQTADGLYALARQTSASLFNVVYAGIAASLRQLGALSELVVGTSASGRGDADYFDTVGYFTTVVAHRIRFDDGMSVGDLVGRVKATINASMPYTGIPIDIVEEALGMMPGRDHLFEVFIQIHARNKLNGALDCHDGRRIGFRQIDPDRHESMLGLQFEVMEETIAGVRSIRVLMNYRSANYGPEAVERITSTTGGLFALMAREGASRRSLEELGATLAAR